MQYLFGAAFCAFAAGFDCSCSSGVADLYEQDCFLKMDDTVVLLAVKKARDKTVLNSLGFDFLEF